MENPRILKALHWSRRSRGTLWLSGLSLLGVAVPYSVSCADHDLQFLANPISEPVISITSPSNSACLDTGRVNVRGVFKGKSIRSISVNGVPAGLVGNTFEAVNVMLE